MKGSFLLIGKFDCDKQNAVQAVTFRCMQLPKRIACLVLTVYPWYTGRGVDVKDMRYSL
jgi:hypothetical protein